jgi:UDP-N-acetylglucosamine 2-epimerase (non-hydrolysing)
MTMKVPIVVGTRPEVIKMAPVIHKLQERKIPFFVVHSNQHYSANMDEIIFTELELPKPKYNFNVGSDTHANQIANILMKLSPNLQDEAPTCLLVQGDTNTVAAAGLAGSQLLIPVGHAEAGLRSYDRTMPE